jgi:hypothetical protein
MRYDFTAIPDPEVPQAVEPASQPVISTYASESNKTVSVWRAVPGHLLDCKPRGKTNPIRTTLVHQLLAERRSRGTACSQTNGAHEKPAGCLQYSQRSPARSPTCRRIARGIASRAIRPAFRIERRLHGLAPAAGQFGQRFGPCGVDPLGLPGQGLVVG